MFGLWAERSWKLTETWAASEKKNPFSASSTFLSEQISTSHQPPATTQYGRLHLYDPVPQPGWRKHVLEATMTAKDQKSGRRRSGGHCWGRRSSSWTRMAVAGGAGCPRAHCWGCPKIRMGSPNTIMQEYRICKLSSLELNSRKRRQGIS
jgi:hypothetical protein